MQETLHLSSATSPPLPSSTATPGFPSLSRPQHIHFPPPSSSNSISLPPIPQRSTTTTGTTNSSDDVFLPTNSQILQEKLLYLDSLGIDSVYCLTSHPPILSVPLSGIKSLIEFLHSLGLTKPDLRRAFSMCPEILASSLNGVVLPAVTFLLREAHVEGKDLRHVINRRPRLLTRSVERQLRPTLYFLQATIGIDDVRRCAPLLSCSVESKFIPRIDYFLKLGLSKRESISMFRRFPALFCYSIEMNLEPKFNYFVVEMGRELRELVSFPHYFSFSLENRIKPRHKLCVEKGVYLSLPVMLKSSNSKFRDRLDVFFNSSIPISSSPLSCTSYDDFDDYRI